jgi:dihydroorotate dehydrogenase
MIAAMAGLLYSLPRSFLFRLDPETAHGLSLRAISQVGRVPGLRAAVAAKYSVSDAEPVEVFGLRFPNRVGLAAGYDKDGDGFRGLACLGFGHIEVGTVTPQPQPGNPKPRIFRLVSERSVINRMGFPGEGAAYVADRLRNRPAGGPVIGVNIGKQKSTGLEEAASDYEQLVDVFAPLADYLAVNISSPNTPGLRQLQERSFLGSLLGKVAARRDSAADLLGRAVPVLVKLAPDLTDEQLLTAVDVIVESGLDGIIATNTTVSRHGLDHPCADEEGGLSGAALTEMSTRIITRIADHTGGSIPIVGVGGIMGPEDARAKIDAGATLVQLYTGLVYEGPGLVKRILEGLSDCS